MVVITLLGNALYGIIRKILHYQVLLQALGTYEGIFITLSGIITLSVNPYIVRFYKGLWENEGFPAR